MPIYRFHCSICEHTIKKLLKPHQVRSTEIVCCGQPCSRIGGDLTTHIKETLDSGLQTKRVERYSEAERLYSERARLPEDRGD